VKCKVYSEFIISVKTVQENIIVSCQVSKVNYCNNSYQIINYSPFVLLNQRTLFYLMYQQAYILYGPPYWPDIIGFTRQRTYCLVFRFTS